MISVRAMTSGAKARQAVSSTPKPDVDVAIASRRLRKLNPLAEFGNDRLTHDQKAIIHMAGAKSEVRNQRQRLQRGTAEYKAKDAARKAAKRAEAKSVDLAILPVGVAEVITARYTAAYRNVRGNHKLRCAKYQLFVHLIGRAQQNNHLGADDYQPLYSPVLLSIFGKEYVQMRDDLTRWGIIEYKDSYLSESYARELGIDGFSKSYRFAEAYQECEVEVVMLSGLNHRKKSANDRKKRGESSSAECGQDIILMDLSQPSFLWLKENIVRVTIDEAAYAWADSMAKIAAPLPDKLVKLKSGWELRTDRVVTKRTASGYKASVTECNLNQQLGQPYFHCNATNGRLDTPLTWMKTTILENFILVDGKSLSLCAWDLSRSQPYLLLPLLLDTEAAQCGDVDLEQFTDYMFDRDQDFYEAIHQQVRQVATAQNIKLSQEANDKVAYLKNVQYSKNHADVGYRKAFNLRFPTVNKATLELVAEAGGQSLAVLLQRWESDLFLNHICSKLYVALGPDAFVATKHDAIICEVQDKDVVRQIMTDVLYEATGFMPIIKNVWKKKPLATHPADEVTSMTVRTTVCVQATLPEPRGSIRIYRNADELPDHWKAALVAGLTSPLSVPAIPHYLSEVPMSLSDMPVAMAA
jgi:hypothetical protein